MKIVITEHQYEKLLLESSKSIIGDEIKRSKEFIKKIVRSVKEDTKLDGVGTQVKKGKLNRSNSPNERKTKLPAIVPTEEMSQYKVIVFTYKNI